MNSPRTPYNNIRPDPRLSHGLSHGLTLIEMLVVLLIMGLLVSVTALSMGLAGRSDADDAARTAEDLSRLFEHAAQQALVRGEVLGLSLSADADQPVQWWRWTSETGTSAAVNAALSTFPTAMWQAQAETFMPVVKVPAQFTLQLTDSHTAVQADRQTDNRPHVVFMPARDMAAFDLRLLDAQTGQSVARIWVTDQGSIDWSAM